MTKFVNLGGKTIGPGHPVFLVAEIGINHNGSIVKTIELIREIAEAGFDAVKFQKRTPDLCVPYDQRNVMRDTPWGRISYIDYRHKIEFSYDDYLAIDNQCKSLDLLWFASCWDCPSVDFIEQFKPPCYKIASASLTDDELLRHICNKNRPAILSTGMSTMEEIDHAVSFLDSDSLIIAHTTSSYPCNIDELNINMIQTLKNKFDCPIGYSGHETGLLMSAVAVGAGATLIERHVTLDNNMWGSDQAASLTPVQFKLLVQNIRSVEKALGDGEKKIYEAEQAAIKKLRVCKNNFQVKEPCL